MIQGLLTGVNAMQAHQTTLENAANNLANVNTTGFKRSRVEFQDLLYRTSQAPGTFGAAGQELPTGQQVGVGVRVAGISKQFQQGPLESTGRPLDVAIQGDGFLQVAQPNGDLAYTRDGALQVDATGQLVTADGQLLQPPVTLPPDATSVSIAADGTISATTPANPAPQVVGQLTLARFINPSGLHAEGRNLFRASAASGPPQVGVPGTNGLGTLQSETLERSNVEVVSEMIGLIISQRAFEASSRVVRTSDEMWRTANEIVP